MRYKKLKDKKLLLVDGHAVAFHCWYTSDPPSVVNGFEGMVNSAIERNESTHLVVTFDPAPPTFRHHLWPSYKEGRPPVPEEFLEECETVRNSLDEKGIFHQTVKGYEADDVIGTISALAELQGFKTTIFTVDMDLLQLATNSTDIETFSQYHGYRHFNEDSVIERYDGLSPDNIPDFKALVGDPSDNLPGVPGIGTVAATNVFETRNSLEEVYNDLEQISLMDFRGSKRVASLLSINKDQAFLMRKLMRIVRDLDINVDLDSTQVN